MEAQTENNIGLTIPHEYYRKLTTLRRWADNKRTGNGRPITNDDVYHYFRTVMEKLDTWLSDTVIKMGYGTKSRGCAFNVIGWQGSTVVLQETDEPFAAFWTNNVIDHISDQYRFGGLLELWANDP